MALSSELKQSLIDRIRRASVAMTPIPTSLSPQLIQLPPLRAVLFDIYGTLLISAAGDVGTTIRKPRALLIESALDAAGYRFTPGIGTVVLKHYFAAIKASHNQTLHQGIKHPEVNIVKIWDTVVEKLFSNNLMEGPRNSQTLHTLAVEFELRQNPVWMMPGAINVLKDLRKRGIVMGLVSNAQFYTPLMLEALTGNTLQEMGFAQDLCMWSCEHGEAKPSPILWNNAVHRLASHYEIPAGQILAVGNDIRNDIVPPQSLGCLTALFAGDARSLRVIETSPAITPSIIITELKQLLEIIHCTGS